MKYALQILFLVVAFSATGQTVGGAGWCKTSANPNTITALRVVNQRNMCSNVWDTLARKMYYYDYALTTGTKWVEFSPGTSVRVDDSTAILVTGTGTIASPYTVTNKADLSVAAGGLNDSEIKLNTAGQTPIFVKGTGKTKVTEVGDTIKVSGGGGIYGTSDTTISNHFLTVKANSSLTFRSQGDNGGGVVPFKVRSDGSEPDIQGWYANGDSLIIGKSDTEFAMNTPVGLSFISGRVLSLVGDSIQVSDLGTALSSEKTFVQVTPGQVLKKTEGINLNQTNFIAGDGISFSGDTIRSNGAGITDTVRTYAQLRAYTGKAKVLFLRDKMKGGMFQLLSSTATDDKGTIFNSAFSGRKWIRDVDRDRVINPVYWGAIGDGTVHPLSEYYAALGDAQADFPGVAIAALTESVDGAAIEEALRQVGSTVFYDGNYISSVDKIVMTSGIYVLNKSIKCLGSIESKGAKINAGGGVVFDFSTWGTTRCKIDGLGFYNFSAALKSWTPTKENGQVFEIILNNCYFVSGHYVALNNRTNNYYLTSESCSLEGCSFFKGNADQIRLIGCNATTGSSSDNKGFVLLGGTSANGDGHSGSSSTSDPTIVVFDKVLISPGFATTGNKYTSAEGYVIDSVGGAVVRLLNSRFGGENGGLPLYVNYKASPVYGGSKVTVLGCEEYSAARPALCFNGAFDRLEVDNSTRLTDYAQYSDNNSLIYIDSAVLNRFALGYEPFEKYDNTTLSGTCYKAINVPEKFLNTALRRATEVFSNINNNENVIYGGLGAVKIGNCLSSPFDNVTGTDAEVSTLYNTDTIGFESHCGARFYNPTDTLRAITGTKLVYLGLTNYVKGAHYLHFYYRNTSKVGVKLVIGALDQGRYNYHNFPLSFTDGGWKKMVVPYVNDSNTVNIISITGKLSGRAQFDITSPTISRSATEYADSYQIGASSNFFVGPKPAHVANTPYHRVGEYFYTTAPAAGQPVGYAVTEKGGAGNTAGKSKPFGFLNGVHADVQAARPSGLDAGDDGYLFYNKTTNVLNTWNGASWDTSGAITGTGSTDYVTVWSGSNTLTGYNRLTWKNATNRLGIGTASPRDAISINGGNGAISFYNTSNPVPYTGLKWDQGLDGIGLMRNVCCDSLTLWGTFMQRSTGFFGINTTSPTEFLDVNGNLRVRGLSGVPTVLPGLTSAGVMGALSLSGLQIVGGVLSPSNALPSGTNKQTLYNNGSAWLATSNLSNDGTSVGVNTTSPAERLEVAEGLVSSYSSTNQAGVKVTSGGGYDANAIKLYEGSDLVFYVRQDGFGNQIQLSGEGTSVMYDIGIKTALNNGKKVSLQGSAVTVLDADAPYSETARFEDGKLGIGTASPAQTLHVQGAARITGSTGTATAVMGRDGSGDISALGLSGLSISSGTLTAADPSATNELQTLANTSNATTHTVTLSNSGGSVQLVEGSNVTLTTTGTGADGIVTIASTASAPATDLTFTGASSPVTLNSSTGTDVTITAGGINALSATSGNITITATEVDGSATNELQTLANTSNATTHTVTLSNSGGSVQLVEGSNITLTTTGTSSAGVVTVAATGTLSGLVSPRIPYASSANTLADDNLLQWDATNHRMSVGNTGGSPSASVHIAEGSVTSWEPLKAVGTVSNNMVVTLSNVQGAGGNSNLILQESVGGASGGDPVIQQSIAAAQSWAFGPDNSNGDAWILGTQALPGNGADWLTVTGVGRVGIKNNNPSLDLSVGGTAGVELPNGTTAQRLSNVLPTIRYNSDLKGVEVNTTAGFWTRLNSTGTPTLAAGTGAGTGPTITLSPGGNDLFGTLNITTGTTPTAGGTIVTVTFNGAFNSSQRVSVGLECRDDNCLTQRNNLLIVSVGTGSFAVRAKTGVAMPASTLISFDYRVMN